MYGLTHLEHWKWEVWETESRARQTERIDIAPNHVVDISEESAVSSSSKAWSELLPDPPIHAVSTVSVDITSTFENHSDISSFMTESADLQDKQPTGDNISAPSSTVIPSSSVDVSGARIVGAPDVDTVSSSENVPVSTTTSQTTTDSSNDHLRQDSTDSLYTTIAVSEPRQASIVSVSHTLSNPSSSPLSQSGSSSSSSVSSSSNQSVHVTRSSSAPSGVPTVTQSLTVVPPPPPATSGESIYRTIMNRLTALESNSSLYARFVEEHAASVREMLRRLSEDIGRLEGIASVFSCCYYYRNSLTLFFGRVKHRHRCTSVLSASSKGNNEDSSTSITSYC